MRTNDRTLVALDTVFGNPFGNVNGNAALLERCRALREGTVGHGCESGNGKFIAALSVAGALNIVDKGFKILSFAYRLNIGETALAVCPRSGNVNLYNLAGASFDSGVVHIDDIVTLLGKRFISGFLHIVDSLIRGNDICY